MSERPTSVRVFKDISYTVSMSLGDNDCYVDFTAYGVTGFDADTERPNYWPKGAASAWPGTHEIAEAEWFCRGHVKWDGCSDIEFNCGECMLHFCGPEDAKDVGVLLGCIYEMAHAMLPRPNWASEGRPGR